MKAAWQLLERQKKSLRECDVYLSDEKFWVSVSLRRSATKSQIQRISALSIATGWICLQSCSIHRNIRLLVLLICFLSLILRSSKFPFRINIRIVQILIENKIHLILPSHVRSTVIRTLRRDIDCCQERKEDKQWQSPRKFSPTTQIPILNEYLGHLLAQWAFGKSLACFMNFLSRSENFACWAIPSSRGIFDSSVIHNSSNMSSVVAWDRNKLLVDRTASQCRDVYVRTSFLQADNHRSNMSPRERIFVFVLLQSHLSWWRGFCKALSLSLGLLRYHWRDLRKKDKIILSRLPRVSIHEPTNVQALSINSTLSMTLSALTEYVFQCVSSLVHSFATSTFYLSLCRRWILILKYCCISMGVSLMLFIRWG